MTWQMLIAIAVIFLAVYLLVKQYETRLVLIGCGLLLCLLALDPMGAFSAFSKRMTAGGLIEAICSSMGFAFVMKYTTCDTHLVRALSKPLSKLGFLLIPATVIVTYIINIAIPSAAGCAAAVGATLIPLLIAARIHPAIAGAAVLCGTFGSLLSPGLSHNPYVAEMANMEVIDLIKSHSTVSISVGLIGAIVLAGVALVKREFNVNIDGSVQLNKTEKENTNYLYATAPFVPLVILLGSNLGWFAGVKFNVPAAMLIGVIYAMVITLRDPNQATKEFFKGMGNSYGDILGIIIAAAVFAEGLKASGLISYGIELLKASPDVARWGGTIGPFVMGIITGSGDAAAYAFNETVTVQAEALGYSKETLGMAAAISGALGRTMSPLAGSVIVCAGLAGVNPIELAKRTAPGMIAALLFVALFML